jgi:Na+-transporting NADH:ubiquinone oxidoreductase subunit D
MAESRERELLLDPIRLKSPLTLLVLGVCPALAVTTQLMPTLAMCLAMTMVMALGSAAVSLVRDRISPRFHIIVQFTIIAVLVIVVDQILKALAVGVGQRISVFVGLIVINGIVMDRIEGFAMRNDPKLSFLDGIGHGLACSVILIGVAMLRELFGAGTLFGATILTADTNGGWYVPNGLLLLPPSAFFLIGLAVWLIRTLRPEQIEEA